LLYFGHSNNISKYPFFPGENVLTPFNTTRSRGKGPVITSLGTGIYTYIHFFWGIGWILSIVAIINGTAGRKHSDGRTLSKVGMWLGIIWWLIIVLNVIITVLECVFLFASAGSG
jgi:hypothetical protein